MKEVKRNLVIETTEKDAVLITFEVSDCGIDLAITEPHGGTAEICLGPEDVNALDSLVKFIGESKSVYCAGKDAEALQETANEKMEEAKALIEEASFCTDQMEAATAFVDNSEEAKVSTANAVDMGCETVSFGSTGE